MSRRPRALIDVDGPMSGDFASEACRLMRGYGVDAHPDKITQWDIFKGFGVSKSIEAKVRKALRQPGVASRFAPRRGALALLRDLRRWADVYAVTAPLDGSPTWAHDREGWLIDRLGFAPEQIISARDKRVVVGDAFVDDKCSHLVEWSAEFPRGVAVLWEEPHNRSDPWAGKRAADYKELRTILEVLK